MGGAGNVYNLNRLDAGRPGGSRAGARALWHFGAGSPNGCLLPRPQSGPPGSPRSHRVPAHRAAPGRLTAGQAGSAGGRGPPRYIPRRWRRPAAERPRCLAPSPRRKGRATARVTSAAASPPRGLCLAHPIPGLLAESQSQARARRPHLPPGAPLCRPAFPAACPPTPPRPGNLHPPWACGSSSDSTLHFVPPRYRSLKCVMEKEFQRMRPNVGREY